MDDAPGTTRDAIDTQIRIASQSYTLVDTAGMRKPRRIGAVLEKATVAAALNRIQHCDSRPSDAGRHDRSRRAGRPHCQLH